MKPQTIPEHFNKKDFMKTAYQLSSADVNHKKEEKWIRSCSYIPILIMLIIVLTICSSFITQEKLLIRIKRPVKCNIQLVESIPDGLNYSTNDPRFMSTYDAWNRLLDLANSTLYIGSFYWTLRGADVVNHTTAAPGEAIFKRLLANGISKKLDLRIAQSMPTENEPDIDTILLAKNGAAKVRSVDFPRLLGNGVLHTKLWIVDQEHFYLGSANMDWRSLTQVKELGVLAENCGSLANDVSKIFEAYWYLGLNTSKIPNQWPKQFTTEFNIKNPMLVEFNNQQYRMSTFVSSSPPPFLGPGRTNDLDAIVNTIITAERFVYVAVMDYFPLLIYTKKMQYWPYIDDALRKAAVENKVSIKLLISWWKHSNPIEDIFLRSLRSLSNDIAGVDIVVRRFVVPANKDQDFIPFGRVNHNKYMVTDNTAYIGTSNWSGDYFTNTAGIGLILREENEDGDEIYGEPPASIRKELTALFLRDWNCPYAVPLQ